VNASTLLVNALAYSVQLAVLVLAVTIAMHAAWLGEARYGFTTGAAERFPGTATCHPPPESSYG
jgi:hypothetical protein